MTSEALPVGPATSLTDWLRRRSDAQLAELLRRRPDLALPAPPDLAAFASRIGVRTSVQRAVDGLDAFTLRVLEAVLLLAQDDRPVHGEAIAQLLAGQPIGAATHELRTLALAWGEDDALHVVAAVHDAVGPYPAGLGRPAAALLRGVSDVTIAPTLRRLGLPPAIQPRAGSAVADVLADLRMLRALIEESTPAERDVLDRLAAGPPLGVVRDAVLPSAVAEPQTPPHRLIRRGLLVPVDTQTVELPREVGLALRGSHPLGEIAAVPPSIDLVERPVDAIGTTAVLEALRRTEALADEWTRHPPSSLRAGGVGVRELRRTARALDVDEPTTALLIEVAAAAGLVGPTAAPEPAYLPTPDFDDWRRRDTSRRWAALAAAWLAMTRQPGLIGLRDDRDRLITVLGPDAERGTAPALRAQLLALLVDIAPERAPADPTAVLARLAWQAPRRASSQRRAAEAALAEAEVLGITASGGLTSYGRALLGTSSLARGAAEDLLAAALPEPVDHFLVQPDLTVVVPGPPTAELAEDLALAATLESTGGASVYRVTEASVRRALDAGRTAADLSALFIEHSRTPVPQALRYLVDDVARRHGVLRAGVAAGYLRCDDEALLARVVADRSAGALGLRRIAPTVAVTSAPVARVLDVLRDAGYAPSAESPDGGVLTMDADVPRAPSRPSSRVPRARITAESPAHLAELIRRMRAGDQLNQLTRRARPAQQIPGVTSAATLGLLRSAIRAEETVWLGYVDSHGTASQHTIEPISMAGGVLRGHDVVTGRLESFALHHITAVSVVDGGTAQ